MIFRITQLSLQVMENGIRRLDFDLVPLHGVIEQVGASETQRCFVADPDGKKFEKLQERLVNQNAARPHAQILSATLYDGLAHSPTREYELYECGSADFLGMEARITSSAMDELIRQDSLGRRVFYVEIAIDGIYRTTDADNEGQLIDSRWMLTDDHDGGKSRVLAIQFHYHGSPVYEEKELVPILPTKDDFVLLQGLVQQQFAESKRIRQYAAILCIIGALMLVLMWSRH